MLHLLLKSALLTALSVQAAAAPPIDPDAFARARFVTQIDGLIEPVDVAIDAEHLISIAVEGGRRVLVFDQSGTLVRTIETLGEEFSDPANSRPAWATDEQLRLRFGRLAGQFNKPADITAHGEQFIVADTWNHRLQLLDANGAPLASYARTSSTPHEGDGALRAPNAVAVSPDGTLMAVCERLEQRCQIFSLTQSEVKEPPSDASAPIRAAPQLYGPRMAFGTPGIALYFPAEQKVMVVDESPPHHMITEFGEYGTRFGQFEHITDLAITRGEGPSEFFVSVADAGQQRISLVKINRAKLDQLGLASVAYVKSIDASALLDAQERGDTHVVDTFGGIDVQPDGTIHFRDTPTGFTIDLNAARVVHCAADGAAVTFGNRGSRDGELALPTDIAVMPDGRIAVLDASHQRVIFFDASGEYRSHFGARMIAPLPEQAWRD